MSEFQWHIVTVTCIPQKCPVVKNITMCTRTLRQHAVYEWWTTLNTVNCWLFFKSETFWIRPWRFALAFLYSIVFTMVDNSSIKIFLKSSNLKVPCFLYSVVMSMRSAVDVQFSGSQMTLITIKFLLHICRIRAHFSSLWCSLSS